MHHPDVGPPGRADREARTSFLLLIPGEVLALILVGVWSLLMNTASTGGDASTLVQGWSGVFRNLPASIILVGLPAAAMVFAARALRHGSRRGHRMLIGSSIGLLFALSAVTRDGAEIVMTTRAATVTWTLFAVDLVIVVCSFLTARWWARRDG